MTRLEEYDKLRIIDAPSSTEDAARQADLYTDEEARDAIAAALEATGGASISVDDASDTITIDASGGSGTSGPKFAESGTIDAGKAGMVQIAPVADGETLSVSEAKLGIRRTNDLPGSPPTGLDLSILINNSGTAIEGEKILQGGGTTSSASASGSPLASYTNSSGGTNMVAIVIDNGGVDSNAGTGSSQDAMASGAYSIQ